MIFTTDSDCKNAPVPTLNIFDDGAQKIIDKFKACGHACYYAGGCVRDALLCRKIYDFDLATDASPDETKTIFADFPLDLKGEKFGTIGIIADGKEYETTTFRSDGNYVDCRHPEKVEFCGFCSVAEDAARRDFTCNALYYNPECGIIDPTGGLGDIKRKLIRAVGCADQRFSEDALRILRALRFASSLGFKIEKETAAAMKRSAHNLNNISKERVFSEIKRILEGEFAFETLKEYGDVLFAMLGDLKSVYEDKGIDLFAPLEKSKNRFCLRFALLYGDLPVKTAETALKNLKADKKTINGVTDILLNPNLDFSTDISVKTALAAVGKQTVENVAEYKRCRAQSKDEADYYDEKIKVLCSIFAENQVYSIKGLDINGNDLAAIGIIGKKTGEVLNYLLGKVICGETANDKSALLSEAERLAKTATL